MKRYIKSAKTIEDYENMGVFDNSQMEWIRWGLEKGLDVSWYADPKFDAEQMKWIHWGLKNGLDVSIYADPKYDESQMYEIYLGLENGIDVSWYADPKFDDDQMFCICTGLEDGVDVSQYADPKYDKNQMWQILEGLCSGLDVSVYADPKFDSDKMREIREGLLGIVPKKTKKKSLTNWKSLANTLQSEAENGIDPLYEQTDAGEKLESVQQEVENALGIWLEPSIEGGMGGIWFLSSEDDRTLASNYDYQTFNEETIDMAIESKNKTEFKKRYKSYLENILNEYAFEEDE